MARDRADAKWLPARYRFAIFQLFAYACFRAVGPQERPGIALAIDRDQSAVEQYTIAAWLTISASVFAFDLLDRVLDSPAALLLAPLAGVVALQVFPLLTLLGPATWRQRNNVDITSFLAMFGMTSAAIYFAGQGGWVQLIAWLFLSVVALNAIAAIVVRIMRRRIVSTEAGLL